MAWGLSFGRRAEPGGAAEGQDAGGGGEAELGALALSPIASGDWDGHPVGQDLELGGDHQTIAIFGEPAGSARAAEGSDEGGRPQSASGAHRLAQPSLPAHRPGTGAGSDRGDDGRHSRPSSGASRLVAWQPPWRPTLVTLP